MTLKEIVNILHTENTETYLEIINTLNGIGSVYHMATYLSNLPAKTVRKLTPTQVGLLRNMPYIGGNGLWFGHTVSNSPFTAAIQSIGNIGRYSISREVTSLDKEDLIFLSTYCKNKWKKANPSTRLTRGTKYSFTMDLFSLAIFKSVIPEKILRTEAKNLLMSVNIAFDKSPKTVNEIKVRNKFYHAILSKTEHLTKAALNVLKPTPLATDTMTYELDLDEVIAVDMYHIKPLMSVTYSSCLDTYSTDTRIVSHNLGYAEGRDIERAIATASAFTTMYTRTANKAYLNIAERTVAYLSPEYKLSALESTESVTQLRNILLTQKEPHEQNSN